MYTHNFPLAKLLINRTINRALTLSRSCSYLGCLRFSHALADFLFRASQAFPLPHVVKVREDERLVDIEATGDDVLDVLQGVAIDLLHGQVLPQVLLII